MAEPTITESRVIDAPASRIFAILIDPAMHPRVDGTGMLRSAVENEPISKVGDVFFMSMTHWSRGNYIMKSLVTEFEQDRRVAWEPIAQASERGDFDSDGGTSEPRRWGWQLEPLSDGRTRVTEFFEGSRLSEGLRAFIRDGEFWRPAMATSLKNLETLATEADGTLGDDQQSATASEFAVLFQRDRI
jgi:hypothetical protein